MIDVIGLGSSREIIGNLVHDGLDTDRPRHAGIPFYVPEGPEVDDEPAAHRELVRSEVRTERRRGLSGEDRVRCATEQRDHREK
ncbi:hypothetical protein GCM10010401_19450 [Rarobacter faecitabidus]